MEFLKGNSKESQPRGQRWLDLIGLKEYADMETNRYREDGSVILLSDFDEICGDHVEGIFNAIESGSLPGDVYDKAIVALRESALNYIEKPQTGNS